MKRTFLRKLPTCTRQKNYWKTQEFLFKRFYMRLWISKKKKKICTMTWYVLLQLVICIKRILFVEKCFIFPEKFSSVSLIRCLKINEDLQLQWRGSSKPPPLLFGNLSALHWLGKLMYVERSLLTNFRKNEVEWNRAGNGKTQRECQCAEYSSQNILFWSNFYQPNSYSCFSMI